MKTKLISLALPVGPTLMALVPSVVTPPLARLPPELCPSFALATPVFLQPSPHLLLATGTTRACKITYVPRLDGGGGMGSVMDILGDKQASCASH